MSIDPQRGEIWLVDLDPTHGAEMRKTRPSVVIGSNGFDWLPLRIIVPLLNWEAHFAAWYWMINVNPDSSNGLTKPSAADTFQIRSVSTQRMKQKMGVLSRPELQEIVTALALVVEYTEVPLEPWE